MTKRDENRQRLAAPSCRHQIRAAFLSLDDLAPKTPPRQAAQKALAPPKQPKKRGLHTFAIERVVASRLNALGKEEYKVRWQGYAERDDTWEPVEHFLPGVIDEFKGSKVPPLERLT